MMYSALADTPSGLIPRLSSLSSPRVVTEEFRAPYIDVVSWNLTSPPPLATKTHPRRIYKRARRNILFFHISLSAISLPPASFISYKLYSPGFTIVIWQRIEEIERGLILRSGSCSGA